MRILLDNGVPRGVAAAPSEHIVEEARSRGWDNLRNGELLEATGKAVREASPGSFREVNI